MRILALLLSLMLATQPVLAAPKKAEKPAAAKVAPVLAPAPASQAITLPAWMHAYMPILAPAALIFGPLGGLLIAVVVMRRGMRQLMAQQKEEMEHFRARETALLSRERQILISTLVGELSENRSKVDAYLIVYRSMLKGLQGGAIETPKYQRVGDIVQKHPVLDKRVFDANLSRLSLLDMKLAGQISKAYASLPHSAEYINLDPGVPLPAAVQMVEGIVKQAETLLPGIDETLRALESAATKDRQAGS